MMETGLKYFPAALRNNADKLTITGCGLKMQKL